MRAPISTISRNSFDYWRDTYDWRKHETALNHAHFKTELDDIGIHFIHERGKGPNPFPIILTQGYPDSFYRLRILLETLRACRL